MTDVICATMTAMQGLSDEVLRRSLIFRRLMPEDRQRLAAVAAVREFQKGARLFTEGDPSDFLYRRHAKPTKPMSTLARPESFGKIFSTLISSTKQ